LLISLKISKTSFEIFKKFRKICTELEVENLVAHLYMYVDACCSTAEYNWTVS